MKLLPHLPAFETQDMRPVDIIVMGLVVVTILIALYLPIFSLGASGMSN